MYFVICWLLTTCPCCVNAFSQESHYSDLVRPKVPSPITLNLSTEDDEEVQELYTPKQQWSPGHRTPIVGNGSSVSGREGYRTPIQTNGTGSSRKARLDTNGSQGRQGSRDGEAVITVDESDDDEICEVDPVQQMVDQSLRQYVKK